MTLEDIETPQPHYIPGYKGYCPQFIYRVGDTYGTVSHKLLIDPCVAHAERIVLSNRSSDDYHINRPTLREIDLVREMNASGDPVYRHPMVPGYEGFVPRINGKFGQRFSIAATEGLADFERDGLRQRCRRRLLRHRGALQATASGGRSLGERSLCTNDYKLPLSAVRPDCAGIVRDIPADQLPPAPPLPYSSHTPPHFMANDNPEKYLKLGHGGHQPFAWPRFGQGNQPLTRSALCDFTNNYQHRRSTEWSPITNAGVGCSQASGPIYEIYHKNVGLIPNYAGHVPGAVFRFGASYGNDSRDAKRWLRGDFS